ncbi:GNAT family N-acetyltransferase [Paraburkholderia sp. NMBU_R16]|uniref:GNAT family N-acetyltransferase n=1 Tax=Paraburkholderia sp. NMBU_R16 TaxID=2698676 RepID=UPI001564D1C5|nr:GNAT family N-acetyltransferase [Paraburkholderia sp. NMBU_R16]NRO99622.1 GNAT family N-acetyltransferase [Paraburkholderia sp. NMBU_R16]
MMTHGIGATSNDESGREFLTPRLRVFAIGPAHAAQLCGSLFKDDEVAARVPWMAGKPADAVAHESLRIQLLCAAGSMNVWAIQQRQDNTLVGAILESPSLAGSSVEVILGREYWGLGIADEALAPVLNWMTAD